jgi:methylenetetrahydrofolate dehydrogenase (NADP+)/methenyltetrahydrofolate cyclohydrolase
MSSVSPSPYVLDGIAIASQIKSELAVEIAAARARGYTPGLAVVLVGEVPASQIYVRSKVKTCAELGIYSDGILIQLPLPAHVDTARLLEAVDPAKDVDGFHPINAGRLLSGFPPEQVLAPCTPAGIIEVLERSKIPIAGQRAVVLGRSNIVGKPIAAMLLNASATVTICHSKTHNLEEITREADILVAAIGRPGFVTREMVRPGATIIDVGINRLTSEADLERFFPGNEARRAGFAKRGSTIVGDVDPKAFEISSAYTPVPGGVGALTIAMLMVSTVKAARLRRG